MFNQMFLKDWIFLGLIACLILICSALQNSAAAGSLNQQEQFTPPKDERQLIGALVSFEIKKEFIDGHHVMHLEIVDAGATKCPYTDSETKRFFVRFGRYVSRHEVIIEIRHAMPHSGNGWYIQTWDNDDHRINDYPIEVISITQNSQ